MDLVRAVITWFANPSHWSGANGVPDRLAQHVGISAASLAIAVAIALPIGLYIGHTGRGQALAINAANLGRAVPSLAAIAIVVPFTQMIDPARGFNLYPTIIAMVVLAMPPILVNSYAGIAEVDRDLVESARGMGMTERQILRGVEIPLAIPVIMAGVRIAVVINIGITAIATYIGAGGLGAFISRGISQTDSRQLITGALAVSLLAIAADYLLLWVQHRLTPVGIRTPRPWTRRRGLVRTAPA